MATTGIHFWSTTAATNATADSAVNWAEGQAPSSVNDSARALMASAAKTYKDLAGALVTAGTSTAYTLTTNQVFADAAAMSGAIITFTPHTTSGASPTLSVDGLTARPIRTASGTNVPTFGLVAATPYTVTYVHGSTEFILHGGLGVFAANSIAVSGTASVGGAATLSNTLAVSGAATFASTASVGGATTLSSTLAVTGAITGSSTVSATGITASGALSGATAAGAMLASQAEQETGTATNKVVQPGVQHFHPSAVKAWGNIQGSNGADLGSYNITSFVRNVAGSYTVTLATDLSSTNYAVTVSCFDPTFTSYGLLSAKAAGSFTILVVDAGGVARDPSSVSFVVLGDFA